MFSSDPLPCGGCEFDLLSTPEVYNPQCTLARLVLVHREHLSVRCRQREIGRGDCHAVHTLFIIPDVQRELDLAAGTWRCVAAVTLPWISILVHADAAQRNESQTMRQ